LVKKVGHGREIISDNIKTTIKTKTNAELIEEIASLYKTFPQVKEYYQATFSGGDDSAIQRKYKDIVMAEFVPGFKKSFPDARLSIARKAISDYKKVASSKYGVADIMLAYVEAGVIYTNEFGDIDQPFYNSMESMYESTFKLLVSEHMLADFDGRLLAVVTDTSGIGWGFHDQLRNLYEDYTDNVP
jgi:hypothetical protein